MAKNNHSGDDNRRKLDDLLSSDATTVCSATLSRVLTYARFIANIENVLVVVSNLADRKSYIIAGGFADCLGIPDYCEDSIWESRVLSLMSPQEQEEKYIAELRFFHFLRHVPRHRRPDYYLVSKLRIMFSDGNIHDVLHRMYYIYGDNSDTARFAICIYGPLTFDIKGKCHVVNSITGMSEELTASTDKSIISRRECQVLSLIDSGMKSAEIAEYLNISIHTVNRHRQEIIGRLQVKNSHEACRIAKSMGVI